MSITHENWTPPRTAAFDRGDEVETTVPDGPTVVRVLHLNVEKRVDHGAIVRSYGTDRLAYAPGGTRAVADRSVEPRVA